MPARSTSMLRGTILLTITGICTQVVGFIYRIALSRLIGAEILGLYQLILPVSTVLLSLTAVGLTVATSNLSAQYHALKKRDMADSTLAICVRVFLLLFALPALLVVLFSDQISVYLLGDARTQLGLLLLLPCIFLTGIENLHKHYFYGAGLIRPPATVEMLEQFIRAGAVLSLLVIFLPVNPERTVGLIVCGMIVCEIFSATALTLLYRRHRKEHHAPNATANRHGLPKKIFAIALPAGGTALLGNLMMSANAVLIPQRLVASGMAVADAMSAFGILFGMTMPLLALPSCFIGALGLILVPKLAESTATGRLDITRHRIGKTMVATSILIMPALAFLVVLGPTVGALLFQQPAVGDFLVPLAFGVLLCSYESLLSCALNGIGKQGIAARNALICGAVQLLFSYFIVGRFGIGLGGFVVGFVVSSLLGTALNWHAVASQVKLKADFFQWFLCPSLAALLSGLCGNLLFQFLQKSNVSGHCSALICLLFCGSLYYFSLVAQGVYPFQLFRLR